MTMYNQVYCVPSLVLRKVIGDTNMEQVISVHENELMMGMIN